MKFLRYIAARASYDAGRSIVRKFRGTEKIENKCADESSDTQTSWNEFGAHLRIGLLWLCIFILLTFVVAGAAFLLPAIWAIFR